MILLTYCWYCCCCSAPAIDAGAAAASAAAAAAATGAATAAAGNAAVLPTLLLLLLLLRKISGLHAQHESISAILKRALPFKAERQFRWVPNDRGMFLSARSIFQKTTRPLTMQ